MSTSDEIYGKVTTVLVEALNADEDEITPAATLQGDLGAESIDFLDIIFRLEREFGITIPRGELFPESVFQGDPNFVQEGKVTDQGMDALRARMPYADLRALEHDRRLSTVADLFTVGLIVRYIAWKLQQAQSQKEPATLLNS
jgi:acyl carrier protein